MFVAVCLSGTAQQLPRSTKPIECDDLKAGQTVTKRTAVSSFPESALRVYATVTLRRPPNGNADECTVTYKLFIAEGRDEFAEVKRYSEHADGSVGVQLIGTSKSGKFIAADFWWAAGDYTGHRPVIYETERKTAHLRELNDEIRKQLPSCDYFEEFVGVTDRGEAIIRVPKSVYVEQGCPAQGDWTFDTHSGSVHRIKKSR